MTGGQALSLSHGEIGRGVDTTPTAQVDARGSTKVDYYWTSDELNKLRDCIRRDVPYRSIVDVIPSRSISSIRKRGRIERKAMGAPRSRNAGRPRAANAEKAQLIVNALDALSRTRVLTDDESLRLERALRATWRKIA